MANKYKGTSYDTLKSYLDSIDVDTSNMDNDTLDSQYLQRLTKRNGEALSHNEQLQGNISLQQYLSDAQALQNKNEAIAQAENNARQETAYNDYVNSKLAKYLNIAEENNGTAGYTGITEGNRIALANQEKNIASNIQNTKQNAISGYLRDYNQSLMDNSRTALDQTTSLMSALDEKAEYDSLQNEEKQKTEYSALEDVIDNIITTSTRNSDGRYDDSVKEKIMDYINKSNMSDEYKNRLIRDVETRYQFGKSTTSTTGNVTIDETGRIITDTLGYNHNTSFKRADGTSIDVATNNGNTKYKFTEGDQDYWIRSQFDNNGSNLATQIESIAGLYTGKFKEAAEKAAEDVQKTSMKNGEYYNFESKGYRVIIYKRQSDYVVFVQGGAYNTGSNKAGFDALWNKIENKKTQTSETSASGEATPA